MSNTSVSSTRHRAAQIAACLTAVVWATGAGAATVAFSGTQMNVDAPTGPAAARCGGEVTVNIGNGPDASSTGTSNFGDFLSTQSHCIAPPPPVSYDQGLFEYDFASGDALFGTYTGDLTASDSPGLFNNLQDFTVTGGTGRFAGAMGAFVGIGVVDFRGPTPSAHLAFDGTLDAAGIPEPSTWAMLILGFLGTGVAARRAHRAVILAGA
jgi:hypothetical protein